MMQIFRKSSEIIGFLNNLRAENNKIGFVPTMGALHQGHLSLIERAKKENDKVVCSIFVNPTQFNDPKDFELYPRTPEKDIPRLEEIACDILFLPNAEEIYPPGNKPDEKYDLGQLESVLEGKYRPGHFQGVCRVMHRLMHIIDPGRLYLGQKDFQQCLVIRKLLALLDMHAEIVICPTQREVDGLAMSSRNARLDVSDRQKAVAIFDALSYIKKNLQPDDLNPVKQTAKKMLSDNGFRVDYVEIAATGDLEPVSFWDGKTEIVALVAAYLGDVRLIDNMVLSLNFAPYAN